MAEKSIRKNAIYNIIYKVLNVIFPIISTAYVSRVLLADGIGRFSSANNNVSYFLMFASLGIPVLGLREIAKNRKNIEERNRVFNDLFVINFILTGIAYIIFNIMIFSSDYFQSDLALYEILGIALLLNIFNIDWLFQGLEEYKYIATRSSIVKGLSTVLLFMLVRNKNDIYWYAVVQVLATTGNYILNVIKAKSIVSFSFKKLHLKKYIKPLIFLALCSISTELYARIDISMLSAIKGDVSVGYYASSQKIINLLITTLVAATAVLMPRLNYLFHNDRLKFNVIIQKGFNLMVSVSIPLAIGIIICAKPLTISFLGNDFEPAWPLLSILSVMVPLKCVGDIICYQVMISAGGESILMRSYFVTLIINIVSNAILIPKFGAEGAAVASVVSEIIAFVVVLWFSRRYFKINGKKRTIGKTIVCSIVMGCCILPVFFVDNLSPFLKVVIEAIAGIFVFVAIGLFIKHDVVLRGIDVLKKIIDR